MNTPEYPFTFNQQNHHFELEVEGHIAFIEYSMNGDIIILPHTEVPAALEGRGIGKILAEKTLQYIEEKGWKVVPLCPFVKGYIQRHPEWERIVHHHGQH